jgi:hypothetical protein
VFSAPNPHLRPNEMQIALCAPIHIPADQVAEEIVATAVGKLTIGGVTFKTDGAVTTDFVSMRANIGKPASNQAIFLDMSGNTTLLYAAFNADGKIVAWDGSVIGFELDDGETFRLLMIGGTGPTLVNFIPTIYFKPRVYGAYLDYTPAP